MTRDVQPEWLTVRDLMTLTGLSRTKCYEMIWRGEIEAIKVGRSIRISKASYHEWTRQHRYPDVAGR